MFDPEISNMSPRMPSRHQNGKLQDNVIHRLKEHSASTMIDNLIFHTSGHSA
jgi:hypothetical protein